MQSLIWVILLVSVFGCEQITSSNEATDTSQIDAILALQSNVRKKLESIQTVRDQIEQLEFATGPSRRGCTLNRDVTLIEVEIKSSEEPPLEVTAEFTQTKNEELREQFHEFASNPKPGFRFKIGDPVSKKYINFETDEDEAPLFAGIGVKKLRVPEGEISLAEIKEIVVTKSASDFVARDPCQSRQCTQVEFYTAEKHRKVLDEITLKVNSRKIYSRNRVNHTFAKYSASGKGAQTGLTWTDSALVRNEFYVSALADPCSL